MRLFKLQRQANTHTQERSVEGFSPRQPGGRLIQRLEVWMCAIFFGIRCDPGVLGEGGEGQAELE